MTLDLLHQRTYAPADTAPLPSDIALYSADSHVIEPKDLWKNALPARFRDAAPDFGGPRPDDVDNTGGTDPSARVEAMDVDGVSVEVLYATWGLKLLALDDPELEAACVRVYNDWLIDFCRAAPDRLIGLALLSCYDIDRAIDEMTRCRDAGMRGISLWQIPRADLRFDTDHYDPLWAAAQDLSMPVSLHILSGHGYRKHPEMMPTSTDMTKKLAVCMDSIHDIIYSGVLERFPRLKVVMAENEIGWLPFVLEQWDFYVHKGRRHFNRKEERLKLLPSEYFRRQMYATFFNDAVGGHLLSWWGHENCMWSNDFPHSNSTWPVSRDVIGRDLGHLPPDTLARVVHRNCAELYQLPLP